MKLALLLLFLPAIAFAHPVSQGSLDVDVLPNKILLHLRVPAEEVLIANAFSSGNGAGSLADAWSKHGEYLLQHFQVFSGSQPLRGRLIELAGPDKTERVSYDLEYPLGAPVSVVRVEQNALREIEYAPGNPWEASFVVRINGAPPALLTAQQPVA